MIWLFIILIATLVIFVLVQPFFRHRGAAASLDERDYLTAQLLDIERSRGAGYLTDEEAKMASLEARRRLLKAEDEAERETPVAESKTTGQIAVMLTGAAPIAAVALYMGLGNPGLDPQRSERPPVTASANAGASSVQQSIEDLSRRLDENPDDLDGWVMLADSYASLDRFAESARAFERAIEISPERAFLHAARGEALTMANGGVVTPEALKSLENALEIDPSEPRAQFYKALNLYQNGDSEGALDALVVIANHAAPGAPWLPIVQEQIQFIAGELGTPIDDLSLTDQARAALGGSSDTAETLEARIASGEAAYSDWISLANLYAGNGDQARALETLDRAKERYSAAPFVLQEIAAARSRIQTGGDASATRRGPSTEQMQAAESMTAEERNAMIEGMVGGLAARLEEQPDDLEGWTMLGRSYGVLGRSEESAAAFARAAELAPDDLSLRLSHAEALLSRLNDANQPIDAPTVAALKEVERLNPEHPMALYFLGLAAQQNDEKETARAYWEKLRNLMPQGSEDASTIQEMIDAL